MSIMDYDGPVPGVRYPAPEDPSVARGPLHRLATVRRRQDVSRRTVARLLNIGLGQVRAQEQENADLLLTTLYQWQQVLEVPVAELLVETNDPLSPPVMKRAQMVRLMKTAKAILEQSQQASVRRMAQVLAEQLIQMMPELEEVSPWHTVGQRRTQDELGQAADRGMAFDIKTFEKNARNDS